MMMAGTGRYILFIFGFVLLTHQAVLSCAKSFIKSEKIENTDNRKLNSLILDLRTILKLRLKTTDLEITNYLNQSLNSDAFQGRKGTNDLSLFSSYLFSLLTNIDALNGKGGTLDQSAKMIVNSFSKTSISRILFEDFSSLQKSEYARVIPEAIIEATLQIQGKTDEKISKTQGVISFINTIISDKELSSEDKINSLKPFCIGAISGLTRANSTIEVIREISAELSKLIFSEYDSHLGDDKAQLREINQALVSTMINELSLIRPSELLISQILSSIFVPGVINLESTSPEDLFQSLSELARALAKEWLKADQTRRSDVGAAVSFFDALSFEVTSAALKANEENDNDETVSQSVIAGINEILAETSEWHSFSAGELTIIRAAIDTGRSRALASQ